MRARGSTRADVRSSTWIALRVRGSYNGRAGEVAAHTSAVQVRVEGSPLFSESDAGAVLDQIQGALTFVDTLAPRPDAHRLRELRMTLETSLATVRSRLHEHGFGLPDWLHDPGRPHEH
jgi:hypothetical protein